MLSIHHRLELLRGTALRVNERLAGLGRAGVGSCAAAAVMAACGGGTDIEFTGIPTSAIDSVLALQADDERRVVNAADCAWHEQGTADSTDATFSARCAHEVPDGSATFVAQSGMPLEGVEFDDARVIDTQSRYAATEKATTAGSRAKQLAHLPADSSVVASAVMYTPPKITKPVSLKDL